MDLQPRLTEMLPPGTAQRWHTAALEVLEQTGMAVPEPSLAARLAACPGIRVRNGRAHFSAAVVQRLVDATCHCGERPGPAPAGARVTLHVGSHAHHYLDPATDRLRPMTTVDVIAGTRLVNALQNLDVRGSTPGVPQDVPVPVRALAQMRLGCLYSRQGGVYAYAGTVAHARWLKRLAEARGQSFSLSVHLVSPLQLSGNELDTALAFVGEDVAVTVGSMPVMGTTAPQSFAGAIVQGLAECLGGFAAFRLLGVRRVGFAANLFSFDHRCATVVYGSPEQNLADAVQVAANRYYRDTPLLTRSIRSTAKEVGVQSCAERAASAVWGVLLGSRDFGGAGLLSLDEVFSPLQLVLDREIADYAGRLAAGVTLDDTAACLAMIRAGVEAGGYLGTETTLQRYRSDCWTPHFFERRMLETWFSAGARSALEQAREAAVRLVGQDTYECPAGTAAAVEEVYRAACRELEA